MALFYVYETCCLLLKRLKKFDVSCTTSFTQTIKWMREMSGKKRRKNQGSCFESYKKKLKEGIIFLNNSYVQLSNNCKKFVCPELIVLISVLIPI